jgi:hypothetical protein
MDSKDELVKNWIIKSIGPIHFDFPEMEAILGYPIAQTCIIVRRTIGINFSCDRPS